jgi:hypothetical protein
MKMRSSTAFKIKPVLPFEMGYFLVGRATFLIGRATFLTNPLFNFSLFLGSVCPADGLYLFLF